MLMRFTVENFLSFHQRIDFNMIASPETTHPHHIVKGMSEQDIGLLRTSILYGANTSGKSNLIHAMNFAKNFIVDGVEKNSMIPVIPFKLDKTCDDQPSRFEFEFRLAEKQFAYGFLVDRTNVYEEWLFEITPQHDVRIFERMGNSITFNFDHDLFGNISPEDTLRIKYEAKSTRENLLFLTNTKERNIGWLHVVYGWFQNFLRIIFPTTVRNSVLVLSQRDQQRFTEYLKLFDLGMTGIQLEEVDLKNGTHSLLLEEQVKQSLSFGRSLASLPYKLVMFDDTEPANALKLSTIHHDKDGNDILFDFLEESDGTQRMIDFIPVLFHLHKYKNIVYVIDEIENSLHPLLIRKFFDVILNHAIFDHAESQFIASTHEVHLLDVKKLFRKDEIWFMEKNQYGESMPYSLANAKVDNLDLVNGYLKGRFGAIPFFKDINELGWKE